MKLEEIRNVRENCGKKHLVLTVSPRIIGYNHRKFAWLGHTTTFEIRRGGVLCCFTDAKDAETL